VPPTPPASKGRRRWSTGDLAEIGDGPAQGLVGEVLAVDDDNHVAQVRIRIAQANGQFVSGVAVVSLTDLHVPGSRARYSSRPQRGRPRSITSETAESIVQMYATGEYSHAMIAQALGVSKTSVANYLRQARTPSDWSQSL
jgi:DNA-binding NarL/FixJ family response regulator